MLYHIGPTQDQERILDIIKGIQAENSVNPHFHLAADIGRELSLLVSGKYDVAEINFLLKAMIKSRTYRKNNNFFQSFRFLFYIINSLQDNKFVYLFTKGLPNYTFIDYDSSGSAGSVSNLMKSIAQQINNAGAFLSVVNPEISSQAEGDFAARQLAESSGSKYFTGTVENIARQLKNYHQSYYELAFADIVDAKKNTRKINIKSLKKGIKIFTFKSLKEKVKYADMNEMEKKLHVVNTLLGNIPTSRMVFDIHPSQVMS